MHLLKASSKPVPQERKRRKIGLIGTPAQYMEHVSQQNSLAQSQAQSVRPSAMREEIKREQHDKMDEISNVSDIQARMNYPRRNRGKSKEKQITE